MITLSKFGENFKFRTGLEIAGLLASAVGTGLGVAGAAEDKAAMNQKLNAEVAGQQGFEKTGAGLYQTSQSQSTPEAAQKQITAGQQQAQNLFNKVAAVPYTATTGGQSVALPGQNTTVQDQRQQQAQQLSSGLNSALTGYSNYGLQQYLKDLTANAGLGVNAANSRSLASILPYQLQSASHAGDSLSGFGSLLNALGGVLGVAGGLGAGAAPAAHSADSLWGANTFGNVNLTPVAGGATAAAAPASASAFGFGDLLPLASHRRYLPLTATMLGQNGYP